MLRIFFALSVSALVAAAPTAASADEKGAAAGAVTGAVAGALVGGPVGAILGAAVGGVVVGGATGPGSTASAAVEEPAPSMEERGLVQRPVRAARGRAVADPEATGSVVETTCVRDGRGNTRCRNEFVR